MNEDDEAGSVHVSRVIERMLFFSDAVFAIVLTLLVLELKLPEVRGDAALAAALRELAPKFIAFAASFALVSIFWLAHMAITRRQVIFDWTSAWLNLVFLFTIAVMPFASALLGVQGTAGLGWRIYCAELIAASGALTVLVLALTRGHGRFVGGITWREKTWRILRAASPGIAFGVGLWLSLQGRQELSSLCWLLIPVLLLLTQLFFAPRR